MFAAMDSYTLHSHFYVHTEKDSIFVLNVSNYTALVIVSTLSLLLHSIILSHKHSFVWFCFFCFNLTLNYIFLT